MELIQEAAYFAPVLLVPTGAIFRGMNNKLTNTMTSHIHLLCLSFHCSILHISCLMTSHIHLLCLSFHYSFPEDGSSWDQKYFAKIQLLLEFI